MYEIGSLIYADQSLQPKRQTLPLKNQSLFQKNQTHFQNTPLIDREIAHSPIKTHEAISAIRTLCLAAPLLLPVLLPHLNETPSLS